MVVLVPIAHPIAAGVVPDQFEERGGPNQEDAKTEEETLDFRQGKKEA